MTHTNPSPINFIRLLILFGLIVSSIAFEEFQEANLQAHNEYRSKHNAAPLKLTDELNKKADMCAQYYISLPGPTYIDHSCPHKGKSEDRTGENLYQSSHPYDFTGHSKTAVKRWYDEVKDYNFQKGEFNMSTGHFTQVVWKKTTEIGVGVAKKEDSTVVVTLYYPAGNVQDQFKENVQESASSSSTSPSRSSFAKDKLVIVITALSMSYLCGSTR